MKKKNKPKSREKGFDELWEHWINLSDIRTGVNFNHFRDGIKQGVVKHLLKQARQEGIEEIEKFVKEESGKSGRKEILNFISELKKKEGK